MQRRKGEEGGDVYLLLKKGPAGACNGCDGRRRKVVMIVLLRSGEERGGGGSISLNEERYARGERKGKM